MKVMSWNVGLNWYLASPWKYFSPEFYSESLKRGRLLGHNRFQDEEIPFVASVIEAEDPDQVFLHELDDEDQAYGIEELLNDNYTVIGAKGVEGSSKKKTFGLVKRLESFEINRISSKHGLISFIATQSDGYTVVSGMLSPLNVKGRLCEVNDFLEYLERYFDEKLLVIGDMNIQRRTDSSYTFERFGAPDSAIYSLFASHFIDLGKGAVEQPTTRAGFLKPALRLDYAFSRNIPSFDVEYEVLSPDFQNRLIDHKPIVVTLQ